LEEEGIRLLRRDGRGSGRWIALDYGGIVVHVLLTEAREFYRLEQMWEEGKVVEWELPEKPKIVVKPTRPAPRKKRLKAVKRHTAASKKRKKRG
jgi:ribosome-associated protein